MAEEKKRTLFTALREHADMNAADAANARCFRRINRKTESCVKDDSRPVLFFNASTRLNRCSLNAAYAWVTGSSLRYCGVPVHFLSCGAGLKPCLLSVGRGESTCCKGCAALSEQLYDGLPHTILHFEQDHEVDNDVEGLDHAGLSAYVHEGVPLGELTLPSLRWILRRHHLEEVPEAASLQRNFIRSAWSSYVQAARLMDELNPRAVVVFNGLQYPEAVVKWLGKQRGIPTFTHEIGLMPNTAIFTEGEATACPIELPDDFEMTPERDAKLDAYLSKRMKGTFSTAGVQFWPDMQALSPEFWERARQYRQIVPVFTNVIFDTSQKHANTVFSDMFAWLDEVKKLMENHIDTLFVIRAHPDESRPGKESHETVTDWVKRNQLFRLPNVLYVPPEKRISSYELIQNSKFSMVYNSTIGLEAAIMGGAVLCAGRSRYTQVPLCYFPQTIPEYLEKAEELLNCDVVEVPSSFQQTARRFMYYQFFHTALSFESFMEPDKVWKGYVNMKIVAFVPMRHHSVRVIGKNYRLMNGKPLYHYIMESLLQVPEIDQVVVDTDSPVVIEGLAKDFPTVSSLLRPEHLRADDVPMNEILMYDTAQVPADYYLQTHSTNPLLKPETISAAIRALQEKSYLYDSLFSVTEVKKRYWDQLARPINHNQNILLRTQDLPPIYEENSCIYLFTREVLEKKHTRIGDRPLLFPIDPREAQDIDDEFEFAVTEMMMKRMTQEGKKA